MHFPQTYFLVKSNLSRTSKGTISPLNFQRYQLTKTSVVHFDAILKERPKSWAMKLSLTSNWTL